MTQFYDFSFFVNFLQINSKKLKQGLSYLQGPGRNIGVFLSKQAEKLGYMQLREVLLHESHHPEV